ncbi:hypothetical protein ACFLZ7_01110 [Nanoarchaeota archaeon]
MGREVKRAKSGTRKVKQIEVSTYRNKIVNVPKNDLYATFTKLMFLKDGDTIDEGIKTHFETNNLPLIKGGEGASLAILVTQNAEKKISDYMKRTVPMTPGYMPHDIGLPTGKGVLAFTRGNDDEHPYFNTDDYREDFESIREQDEKIIDSSGALIAKLAQKLGISAEQIEEKKKDPSFWMRVWAPGYFATRQKLGAAIDGRYRIEGKVQEKYGNVIDLKGPFHDTGISSMGPVEKGSKRWKHAGLLMTLDDTVYFIDGNSSNGFWISMVKDDQTKGQLIEALEAEVGYDKEDKTLLRPAGDPGKVKKYIYERKTKKGRPKLLIDGSVPEEGEGSPIKVVPLGDINEKWEAHIRLGATPEQSLIPASHLKTHPNDFTIPENIVVVSTEKPEYAFETNKSS